MKIFQRYLNDTTINNFKSHKNFKDIYEKVKEGVIFPAIRENQIDFYCGGQRAFQRKSNVFRTNSYFLENTKEQEKSKDQSFFEFPYCNKSTGLNISIYKLLSNCVKKGKLSSLESSQISKLFKKYSWASTNQTDAVLIDVEIQFISNCENNKKDKIDLAFIINNESLLFVEAKRRNDSRIRSKNGEPKVISQVNRYKKQLFSRKSEILKAYENSSNNFNNLFGYSYAKPKNIIAEVPLLIIGDDLKPRPLSNDTWLEPELEKENKIWEKDGICLIDARELLQGKNDEIVLLSSLLQKIVNNNEIIS